MPRLSADFNFKLKLKLAKIRGDDVVGKFLRPKQADYVQGL